MSQLKLINYRSGFSLLEVVISLLIISVTFLAYGQLIEQNLRAQDLKQNFIDDHQLKTNVLTIYVANPMIDNNQIRELLDLDSISHRQLSRYNALVEIEIEFEKNSDKFSFKVIR
jgi:prepilin-type N-terminal cleavage/methylation domain-containing protein|tara:strand:- start:5383 stop:5727 length:345 start_codon:yes stop_codon:yes gene_type:complete